MPNKVIEAKDLMERRRCDLEQWLQENAAEAVSEQRHLDEGSPERAYWHAGYLEAMKDVLALIGKTSTSQH